MNFSGVRKLGRISATFNSTIFKQTIGRTVRTLDSTAKLSSEWTVPFHFPSENPVSA